MELALLYNGGKDSSLATLPLNTLYNMTLVTVHFGVTKDWTHARDMAAGLGYALKTPELDHEIAAVTTTRMVEDDYPRGGIQYVHEHALEMVCGLDFDAAADGTRHDDRIPPISQVQAQSLENHHGVDYLSPLSGLGHGAVNRPIESYLDVEIGSSEEIPKADYEGELHHLITTEHGQAAVDGTFPDHVQSYVHGRR